MEKKSRPNQANEGEGSKTADKKYRDDAAKFIHGNDVDKLAKQAADDVGNDPDEYRRAEEEGKAKIAEEDPELKR